MGFFDFAWSTSFQITKKRPDEIKILLQDNLKYPYLGKDSKGYVIHLIKPKRSNKSHINFQGLKFNPKNPTHNKIIWYLFKASVYHLNMHLLMSDFSIYSKWARGKQPNLATFVISLVEDAVINEHLRHSFRWAIPETAYANAISFVRMKNVEELPNDTSRMMASTLLDYNLGMVKGKLKGDMLTDVNAVTTILQKLGENPTANDRIDAANQIYDAIAVYGETWEVPSLLYAESHGKNDLFYEERVPEEDEIRSVLSKALLTLEPEIEEEQLKNTLQSLRENEAQRALLAWQEHENSKSKILESYAEIGKDTPFESFEFPNEDYAGYHGRREILGGPIRRILYRLRLLKNVGGEDFRQESGFVDLQEAIQVIASKSQRTDIFVREELQTREDAWSILVDASHSLNMFEGEVRGIALCLAEVAKTLILNQNSWGMYAFNDKFYVVKDFSEKYGALVKARIGGLRHGGLTYLPDAILLAAHALTNRLEESRVLVVVSDFFPAGYENAEERLKESVKKVNRMGIGMIGIGVNSRAVKHYIRPSCVVESPFDLMKKFTKAFMEYNAS